MFKIVLIGSNNSGKAELFKNINGPFVEVENIRMMIGADFYQSIYEHNNVRANVSVWSVGSQARYFSIYPQMVRGAKATVFVYNAAKKETFLDLEKWIDMARSKEIQQPIGFIVANVEKNTQRVVTKEQGTQLAKEWGFVYIQISVQEKQDCRDFIQTVITFISNRFLQ